MYIKVDMKGLSSSVGEMAWPLRIIEALEII